MVFQAKLGRKERLDFKDPLEFQGKMDHPVHRAMLLVLRVRKVRLAHQAIPFLAKMEPLVLLVSLATTDFVVLQVKKVKIILDN